MRKISKIKKFMFFEKLFTIKTKLMASFLIALALIIVLGIASYQKASSAIRTNYMDSTCQTLNMTSEYLAFGLNSVEDTATQLISDDNIVSYFSNMYGSDTMQINKSKQTITKTLSAKQVTDEFIENLYLISDKVEPISTKKLSGKNILSGLSETPIGTQLQQNRMTVIWSGADEYLDEKLGTKTSDYSFRFLRRMVSSDGILVIDVSSKTINSILENIDFDETGILGIVTGDGKEILMQETQEIVFTDKKFYDEAVKGTASNGSQYVNYKDREYLFMNSKIGTSGAMICALVPKSTILKQAADIRSFTLIIVIIASIIAILTGFTISNGINKAITGIISGLRRASQGDLTVEFPTKRKDEFKVLIHEIENTFSNMKTIIFGVKSLSGEVLHSSEQVAAATTTFQRSTENISFAMGEVEQGITQQAKDAEGCLIEMDNLSQKIISISDNTKEIGRITEQTKNSINDGTLHTERLDEQTKSTIQITTDIIKKVEMQSQNSLSIGQISNVISSIATQINLLALNASIESARAGEFGKGFAVIANEIRNLAEQSKRSVDEIKAIIGKIQEETKDTMQFASKVEDVLSLQESAVTDTIDSYHNINQNVEQLVIYLKYITDSINTMETSRTSTLGAIESISAVLEEIAASSNTVNQASKEQLSSVDTLGSSSEALYANADKLLQAVQKFLV